MKIKLKNIAVGSSLSAMITASEKDAVFFPICYSKPFAWSFSLVENSIPTNNKISKFLKVKKNQRMINERAEKIIEENGEIIQTEIFYYELEDFLKSLLIECSLLYNDFKIKTAKLLDNNTIIFTTESGSGNIIEVEYDNCYIVNPSEHWLDNSITNKKESIESDSCHVIYELKLKSDKTDFRPIRIDTDWISVENESFNKIWFNKLFGKRHIIRSPDVKILSMDFRTKYVTFICEDVSREDASNDIYSFAEFRKSVYNFLGKFHKRVADYYASFDQHLNKHVIYSSVDVYDDFDNVSFIYEEEEESVCRYLENFPNFKSESSQLIRLKLREQILQFLSTGTVPNTILY